MSSRALGINFKSRSGVQSVSASRPSHVLAFLLLLCLASGCATHGRPPECKGPYTPINHTLTVSSDGTQR